MSILFVGDPHGRWDLIVPRVLEYRPSAIVLLGDMELRRPLDVELATVLDAGIKVYWIPGNHDGDSDVSFSSLFESTLAGNNLSGKVSEIAGIRVAGLGGVFRGRIWDPRVGPPKYPNINDLKAAIRGPGRGKEDHSGFRAGIPIRHYVSIWHDQYECLGDLNADILVTHEAPECHPNGFRAIGALAEAMGAKLLLHGHHHMNYAGFTTGGTRVIGLAAAGIANEKGEIVARGIQNPM